ncbi:MAG: hypothetical protein ACK5HA_00715 [Planctomycetaceae bacterium]
MSDTPSAATASPEFDAAEIQQFAQKDAQAIKVIGRMLVLFFFYSLLVMVAVGYWTANFGGQEKHAHPAGHGEAAEAAGEDF